MDKETRTFSEDIEIRVNEKGKEVISGYAIVFNQESRNLGGFVEYISPEAVRDADMSDVVALFNHDQNLILGRTPGTLTLETDEHGVRYFIDPPDTTTGNDLKVSIKRGDVKGSSFGFTVKANGDVWEKPNRKGDPYKRTITAFDKIWDVSPVVTPAYVQTDTTVAKRELGMLKDQDERQETEALELENAKRKLKINQEQEQLTLKLKLMGKTLKGDK